MSTKTFAEIRKFNIEAGNFINKKDVNNGSTKLGYAIKKISEGKVAKAIKEYQAAHQEAYYDSVQRKQVDFALTDKTTQAVLLAPKGSERPYQYDKEGLLNVMKAEASFSAVSENLLEEFDKKEFEIEPHYAVDLPEDLTDEQKEAFKGFVIE